MKAFRTFLYKLKPFFRFIPFMLLGSCFIQVFTYQYDQLSLFKRVMNIVYQANGFGLLMLCFPVYTFFVEKACIHSRISVIGLVLLCLINIVILSILNIKVWYYGISGHDLEKFMQCGDDLGTIYDCAVISLTFIVATLFFVKEELICKHKCNESTN